MEESMVRRRVIYYLSIFFFFFIDSAEPKQMVDNALGIKLGILYQQNQAGVEAQSQRPGREWYFFFRQGTGVDQSQPLCFIFLCFMRCNRLVKKKKKEKR